MEHSASNHMRVVDHFVNWLTQHLLDMVFEEPERSKAVLEGAMQVVPTEPDFAPFCIPLLLEIHTSGTP